MNFINIVCRAKIICISLGFALIQYVEKMNYVSKRSDLCTMVKLKQIHNITKNCEVTILMLSFNFTPECIL